ncbi:MAG: hypothetical protein ACOCUO_01535, partial [archaeon]
MSDLTPDPAAKDLADQMVSMEDIQREILNETLDSQDDGQILESGRTICPRGGGVKGPGDRHPQAVDLRSCPLEAGGVWHTHVTPRQIRNPEHSIIDVANVAFGYVDSSVVSGTESSDVLVAANDNGQMVEELNKATGVEVNSPEELFEAVESGEVNPTKARRRVRDAFGPLFYRERTGYDDLSSRISRRDISASAIRDTPSGCTAYTYHEMYRQPTTMSMRESCDSMTNSFDEIGDRLQKLGANEALQ